MAWNFRALVRTSTRDGTGLDVGLPREQLKGKGHRVGVGGDDSLGGLPFSGGARGHCGCGGAPENFERCPSLKPRSLSKPPPRSRCPPRFAPRQARGPAARPTGFGVSAHRGRTRRLRRARGLLRARAARRPARGDRRRGRRVHRRQRPRRVLAAERRSPADVQQGQGVLPLPIHGRDPERLAAASLAGTALAPVRPLWQVTDRLPFTSSCVYGTAVRAGDGVVTEGRHEQFGLGLVKRISTGSTALSALRRTS